MIKIVTDLLENDIEFKENYINILEINNKSVFNKLLYLINRNIYSKEDDEIIIYNDLEQLNFSKSCLVIYDYFNCIANQNKVLKLLYEDISKEYSFNYENNEYMELQSKLLNSINTVLCEYEYKFDKKEFLEIKDILKIMDLKFDQEHYDKPFENIMLLIDLIDNLKICKIIIFVNLKCYLKEGELKEVYKMIKYKRINVLLIEFYNNKKVEGENKISIDEDYDEINTIN
ncbi:type II-A CRISPR-associated protein Csn2 [Clostridium chrysemydis]|uniref:type II-A CRISPR-associated protein Csn2 n=1 Tax=Clostridium chrysemydis TaxID=2665504 RepID=UPI003F2E61C3